MRLKLLLIAFVWVGNVTAATLEIKINGLRSHKGNVLYLLFNDEKGFPGKDEKSFRKGSVSAEEASQGIVIADIPEGTYAFSVIHDEDDNKKLNTNLLGMPTEGFGFSNNPRIYFGAPSFQKCIFSVRDKTQIVIELKHFL